MPSPLPLRPSIDHTPRSHSVFDLADEQTAAVLDVLGTASARDILRALTREPATVSDIADDLEMSLQNVQYHLRQLREAKLVTEVDTWYSSKGREMSVYAPTTERLEIDITATQHQSALGQRTKTGSSPAESD